MASRQFIIKHNCGSILVVDSEKFMSSAGEDPPNVICPNCSGAANINNRLATFFENYSTTTKRLGKTGYTIREASKPVKIPPEDG